MDEEKARINYECASCKAGAELVTDLKHEADCKNKIGVPKKICAKSGQAPHATVQK